MIALALLLGMALSSFAACSGNDVPEESSDSEPTVESSEESTTEETTTEAETFDTKPFQIEVKWNGGYVGSATNTNGYANKLNTSGGSYSYTDVIEIPHKGTKISFTDPKNGATSGNAYVVSTWAYAAGRWLLNKDGINIPGGGQYVMKKGTNGTVYTYITSSDNECIRFCYRSNTASTDPKDHPKILAVRTNEPGTYAEILKVKEDFKNFMATDKDRAYFDVLKGLTMNVIGDSYFAGEGLEKNQVWPGIIAEKYEMKFDNKGIGGSTVSNYVTTNNPMVDRYNKMPDNNPQVVIIEGGRNDYNQKVPIGNNGDTSTKTFKGAVNTLIDSVKAKYPNALILAVTVWEVGGSANSAGHKCSDYGNALIEICNIKGVPVFNAMDQKATGVYMTDASFRAQYCMKPNDISHLNVYGMMKVMPVFEKWIADEYSKFMNGTGEESTTNTPSTDTPTTETPTTNTPTTETPTTNTPTTEAPTTEAPTTNTPTTETPSNVISVKWNAGYVGSSSNPYGYANKLNPQGGGYSYTDVIEIEKKGTKITFTDPKNGKTSSNAYVVSAWKKSGGEWVFDPDGANIAGGGTLVISSGSAGTTYTYVTAKDGECIRFCYRSDSTSTDPKDHPQITFEVTNEPGTLQGVISLNDAYNKFMADEKNRVYYGFLEGITMNVIGDSYFAGEGLDKKHVWPAMVADKYGMTFDNKGIGGSTISNYVATNNPMVDRYTNMPNNNPQIVIIEGGRNDYNQKVPIGNNSDTSTKTFKGAVNTLIDRIRAKYPNALILAVTVWEVGGSANSAGHKCSDYGNALIEICKNKGIPVFNAMDQKATGVYMTDASFRAQYCMKPNDISHLNAYGMMKVMPVFEEWIANEYKKFLNGERPETSAPESTTDSPVTTAPAGEALSVKWNAGYVGSSVNPYGYENKLNPQGGGYSYTDVIEIAKKGTTITFTDPKRGSTSKNAYVLSSWKNVNGEWVFDESGKNVAGGGSEIIGSSPDGVTYTYTTTKDNECIRFCYRSDTKSTDPKDHPTVYIEKAN